MYYAKRITKSRYNMEKQFVDWERLLKTHKLNDIEESFDETILYRQIRKEKILQKLALASTRYTIHLVYSSLYKDEIFKQILKQYFGIRNEELEKKIYEIKKKGFLAWNNLSSSIVDILFNEITNFLAENNINVNLLLEKKVVTNVIKKPGDNSA